MICEGGPLSFARVSKQVKNLGVTRPRKIMKISEGPHDSMASEGQGRQGRPRLHYGRHSAHLSAVSATHGAGFARFWFFVFFLRGPFSLQPGERPQHCTSRHRRGQTDLVCSQLFTSPSRFAPSSIRDLWSLEEECHQQGIVPTCSAAANSVASA